MRVHWTLELGSDAKTGNQLTESGRSKRRATLRSEHKRRLRILLSVEPPQRTELTARQRMHRLRCMLGSADVDAAVLEVDRVPPQRDELDRPQTMTVGEQDHGPVAVGMAVEAGGSDQTGDLGIGEVFPGPDGGDDSSTIRTFSDPV
jgi:hypothetical protein